MSSLEADFKVNFIWWINCSVVLNVKPRCSPNPTPQSSAPLLARAVSSWSATAEPHLNLSSSAGDVITALLSFSQGDNISVLQQREDWWLGQLNGTQGWFPKSYVTLETGGNTEYEDTHTHSFLMLNWIDHKTLLTLCYSHSSVDAFDTCESVQLEGKYSSAVEKHCIFNHNNLWVKTRIEVKQLGKICGSDLHFCILS